MTECQRVTAYGGFPPTAGLRRDGAALRRAFGETELPYGAFARMTQWEKMDSRVRDFPKAHDIVRGRPPGLPV